MIGIYKIQNKVNGKLYVGKSIDIDGRWSGETSNLRGNKNKPNSHLQNAWNKYGEKNFKFEMIVVCQETELSWKEQFYIKEHKSHDPKFGYNKTMGGEGGRRTEETKQKISKTKREKCFHHTEETKQKISKAKKGKNLSKEHKQKISKAHKGKKKSIEHRQNISKARKGKKNPQFSKENHPMYGKHHSKEARQKMSKARKGKCVGENNPMKRLEVRGKFKGENNSNSKLTKIQVVEIRKIKKENPYLTNEQIAKTYNVSKNCIRDIILNKTWKDK